MERERRARKRASELIARRSGTQQWQPATLACALLPIKS